jgi:hypothetical protein
VLFAGGLVAVCVYGLADKLICEVERRNFHLVGNEVHWQCSFVSSSLTHNPSKYLAEML